MMPALVSGVDTAGMVNPSLPPPFNVNVMFRLLGSASGRESRSKPLSSMSYVPAMAWSADTFIWVNRTDGAKPLLKNGVKVRYDAQCLR